jgi:ATP-dependent protease HslVU (ClpYQ) peptidase subunit
MTVIAAMSSARAGATWVASDTLIISGNLELELGPKWLVRNEWAIGVAGHLRTMNIFAHHADILLKDVQNVFEFTGRVRSLLGEEGYRSVKEEEGPPNFGQMLMLANSRNIWTIGPDFSITPLPDDKLWAEGSGRDLAIGAAHAMQLSRAELSPREIVRVAIETAITCDAQCGGTAWIAELSATPR